MCVVYMYMTRPWTKKTVHVVYTHTHMQMCVCCVANANLTIMVLFFCEMNDEWVTDHTDERKKEREYETKREESKKTGITNNQQQSLHIAYRTVLLCVSPVCCAVCN